MVIPNKSTKEVEGIQRGIPWLKIMGEDQSIVLCKDGSLLSSFELTGVDVDDFSATRMYRAAEGIERGLRALDEHCTVWIQTRRRRVLPSEVRTHTNKVSGEIEALHQEMFHTVPLYTNRSTITITRASPGASGGIADRIASKVAQGQSPLLALITGIKEAFTGDAAYVYYERRLRNEMVAFSDMLANFMSMVTGVGISQFAGQELLSSLHDAVNPICHIPNIRVPKISPLDSYLGDVEVEEFDGVLRLRHPAGERYISAFTFMEWPDGGTDPGMLDSVLAIDGEIDVAHMLRIVDRAKSEDFIRQVAAHYEFKADGGFKGAIATGIFKEQPGAAQKDSGSAVLLSDAQDAQAALTSGGMQFGYYNCTIFAHGNTLAECAKTRDQSSRICSNSGFLVFSEGLNLMNAWLATLPGQWDRQPRRQLVATGNLADLSYLRSFNTGYSDNKYLTEQLQSKQPSLLVVDTRYLAEYHLNLHQDDLGHGIIIGGAGGGKSTLANLLIAAYQKYQPITLVWDKDRSCRIAIELQGGSYIDFMSNSVPLNPFILLGDRMHWPFLARIVETMATTRGYQWTSKDDEALSHGMENMYGMGRSRWRLQELVAQLPTCLETELSAWVQGGVWGRFVDNEDDGFELSDMTGIEVGALYNAFPDVANVIREYIFYRFEQRLNKGRPGLVYLEELWFGLKDERFRARYEDWLRTMRKKTTSVWGATQSPNEIVNSGIAAVIGINMPHMIFTGSVNGIPPEAVKDFEALGMTEWQIEEVRGMRPKKDYYLRTPHITRAMHIPMSKFLLAYLRSDNLAQSTFDRWKQSGDPDWRANYLKEMSQ